MLPLLRNCQGPLSKQPGPHPLGTILFKSDHAACFANKVLQHETKGKGNYFQDWDAFKKIFSNQFCLKNEQLMALTRLKGTSWYQAKDPVDNYIDHFQELTNLAEYDDDKTIVIQF